MTENEGKRVSVRQLATRTIKELEEEVRYFKENVPVLLNEIERLRCQVQAFEAIGTIEEFNDLKEKNEPKEPITYTHTHRADCPNCRATVRGIDKPFGDYCSKCGIRLDWSE